MANELARINPETMAATVQSLPEVTAWIQRNHDKGLERGKALLDTIEANGGKIDAAMYTQLGEYIELSKKCRKMMNDKRAPITQLMDSYRSVFTSLENDFDVNKKDSIPGRIQTLRNGYAAEAERKRQEEARKAQEAAREMQAMEAYKKGVRGEIESRLQWLCSECTRLIKKNFDAITTKNFFAIKTYIENFKEELTRGTLLGNILTECHVPAPQHIATDFEEQKRIRLEVYESCESEMMIAFAVHARNTKQTYMDMLQERKEQVELAEKDQAAAARKAEEIRKHEQEEAERIKKEQAEAAAKAQQKSDMEAQQRVAMGLFAGMEGSTPQEQVKTKTKRVLRVTSKDGFLHILNYWWVNEGSNLDIEELGKVFKKMITYAEKRANSKDSEELVGEGITFVDEVTAK